MDSVSPHAAVLLNHLDQWANHARGCTVEGECATCIVCFNLVVRAHTVWHNRHPDAGWKSIESAPKDGTPVRLKWEGTTVECVGKWSTSEAAGFKRLGATWPPAPPEWRDVVGGDLLYAPTHWAPVVLTTTERLAMGQFGHDSGGIKEM